MKNLSAKTGFVSAILLACILFAYTIGICVLIVSEPGQWVNVDTYAQQVNMKWHHVLTFCHVMVFLSAPLYLILISCIDHLVGAEQKIWSKISLNFAVILTALGSINYFLQFSMVKLSISNNQLQGLEQFIQLNAYSATYAIVMLAWTFFLGLSSFFIAATFKASLNQKVIKFSFIANGIFCMIGFLGYIFDFISLVVVYEMGMGISMIIISLSLILFFKKKLSHPLLHEAIHE